MIWGWPKAAAARARAGAHAWQVRYQRRAGRCKHHRCRDHSSGLLAVHAPQPLHCKFAMGPDGVIAHRRHAAPTWQARILQPLFALLHPARKQALVARQLLRRLQCQRSALKPPPCKRESKPAAFGASSWRQAGRQVVRPAPMRTYAAHCLKHSPQRLLLQTVALHQRGHGSPRTPSPATAMWCWRRRPTGS